MRAADTVHLAAEEACEAALAWLTENALGWLRAAAAMTQAAAEWRRTSCFPTCSPSAGRAQRTATARLHTTLTALREA